ncbi:MAG: acyltransferase [Betaproteobacteria bacterium]|nr:acyltransferase [Betaproteobacteria bacterium]
MSSSPTPAAFNRHLDYLDGWRGLAIVFLLIGHFFHPPGINFGSVGVSFFFVLSGYLMGQLLFVKNTKIPVFYRRRISRIIPAHLCFILCICIYFLISAQQINWNETVAALFFFNNYATGELERNVMPFGHIWSLSVEEHSYILLSLVAIVVRTSRIPAKRLVAAFTFFFSAMGFWYWTQYNGRELDFGHWLRTEVSAYGIFISVLLMLAFLTRKIPVQSALIYPVLIGAGIMSHWWSIPKPIQTTLGVGLFAFALNLLAAAPQSIKNLLSIKPLRMMGQWSFSIYLWQQPFYLAASKGLLPIPIALFLAMACALASFHLVEQPVRNYLNKVWGRDRSIKLQSRSPATG